MQIRGFILFFVNVFLLLWVSPFHFVIFLRGDVLVFQNQVGCESRDGNTEIISFLVFGGRPTGKSKNKFPQPRQV